MSVTSAVRGRRRECVTISATSSGCRSSSGLGARPSLAKSFSMRGVAVRPGKMLTTRMPSALTSSRKLSAVERKAFCVARELPGVRGRGQPGGRINKNDLPRRLSQKRQSENNDRER